LNYRQEIKIMTDYSALKKKTEELANRKWDEKTITSRIIKLVNDGIPAKKLAAKELRANKESILDRVMLHAEENNYYLKNCAQSTALALMEEFGLGNMEIIRALTPFPGIGGTGQTCGGITGSLIAFGLCFGPARPPDFEKTNHTIKIAQQFMAEFENLIGHRCCSEILEHVIIGYKLNPGESEESMARFAAEKGFEKCCMLPGAGARLAASFIIDGIK
jgi:C_GCAxxG_C_C family probable redox protein